MSCPRIAVIGAPNAGKTTLYNWITGSKFRAVNYPGSTVEFALGHALSQYECPLEVIDTPGVYSLSPKSPEEEVTLRILNDEAPTGVIAVVDATQLARHLFIVHQLQEQNVPVVMALTMTDLLKKKGFEVDVKKLSEILKIPVVVVDGRLGSGVKELLLAATTISESFEFQHHQWDERTIQKTYQIIDKIITEVVSTRGSQKLQNFQRSDMTTRYIDRWVLSPWAGLPIFILILGTLFTSIFWLAQPLMDWVDIFFSFLGEQTFALVGAGLFGQFLQDGFIAGLGAVLVFVPQIFILFLGLTLLEDWGYLARAASIMDRPLSKVGLNGRSFVPLLSGFACAIPAMMAARTISSRHERFLTLFVIPLMSCSARLPVFALLLAYLFQDQAPWKPGLALAAIYILSIVLGMVAAALASRWIRSDETSFFMLELPSYRRPRLRNALKTAYQRTGHYIQRAGKAILVLSVIIWVGTVFPNYNMENPSERLATSYAAQAGHYIEPIMSPMGGDWRVGLSLVSAFAAREVFVSSLALIFNVTDDDEDSLQQGLLNSMKTATNSNGEFIFTTSTVTGLIFFFIVALQCMSTVVIAKKESESWSFALGQLGIFTVAAYLLTVLLVQALRLFGIP